MSRKNQAELNELKAKLEELGERIASQETELGQLRQQMRPTTMPEIPQSRRRMLKRLGAATLGLGLGGAAIASQSQTAQAAVDLSGVNIVSSTALVRPAASFTPPLPIVRIDAEQAPLNVSQNINAALLATGTGSNTAIVAVAGAADVAAADFSVGGISGGSLKPGAIQGRSSTNPGVQGISDSQAGVIGQGATILQVTQRFQANDTNGLLQAGVIGLSDSGLGVAAASATSSAIYANSSSPQGYSLYAARGGHDASGTLTNPNLAPLYLEPSPTAGPPVDNGHRKGELHVDASGKLYICAAPGSFTAPPPTAANPIELRKPQAVGLPSPGTFYQLTSQVYLRTPLRVLGGPNVNFNPGVFPQIPANSSSTYYVKIGGPITNYATGSSPAVSDTVPNDVTAIFGTVVAFAAQSTGYLTIFPANSSIPLIATLIYAGNGAYTSTFFTVRLGPIPAGQPDAGSPGFGIVASVACQISLDLVGYVI